MCAWAFLQDLPVMMLPRPPAVPQVQVIRPRQLKHSKKRSRRNQTSEPADAVKGVKKAADIDPAGEDSDDDVEVIGTGIGARAQAGAVRDDRGNFKQEEMKVLFAPFP